MMSSSIDMGNNLYQPILNWAEFNSSTHVFGVIENCIHRNDISGLWGYFADYFDSKDVSLESIYLNVKDNYEATHLKTAKRKDIQVLAIKHAYKHAYKK